MFDPANPIVALCAQGMEAEGKQPEEAARLFLQAWNEASDDFEKAIAAHYVARQQPAAAAKLEWDKTALQHALKVDDERLKIILPSLYLNIAKGHEDLGEGASAAENYCLAQAYAAALPDDGYSAMIRKGISGGLARVSKVS